MDKMFKVSFSISGMGAYSKCIEINNVPRDMPKKSEDILKCVVISKLNDEFNHSSFISAHNIKENCKTLINIKKINALDVLDIRAI